MILTLETRSVDHLLQGWFVRGGIRADQEGAGAGKWNSNGFGPLELASVIPGGGGLGVADQEGEAAAGSKKTNRDLESGLKALDGA